IAVCIGMSADGAGTYNITVGQKHAGFFIVKLFGFFFFKNSFVVQVEEKFRSSVIMHFIGSAGIYIEGYTEIFKSFPDFFMIPVNYLLWRNPLFHCSDGNGYSVLIAASYKQDVPFPCSLVTYINVCRDITSCKVSDMNGIVCIE